MGTNASLRGRALALINEVAERPVSAGSGPSVCVLAMLASSLNEEDTALGHRSREGGCSSRGRPGAQQLD